MKKSEFKSFMQKVPKAEIHIHIEAVIKLASVKKLYKQCNGTEMRENGNTWNTTEYDRNFTKI